jgi:hypothetical protein
VHILIDERRGGGRESTQGEEEGCNLVDLTNNPSLEKYHLDEKYGLANYKV